MYNQIDEQRTDHEVDDASLRSYLIDHLKVLSQLAEKSGNPEAASLISLAIISLNAE